MVDVGDGYVRCIDRIVDLVQQHGTAAALPMCPEWTLRDLVGHLNGLAEDWALGNLEGYASDPWTAAQVDRHRATATDVLCEELRRRARQLVELPDDPVMGSPARWASGDALVHEADVCEVLGLEPTVPPAEVVRHLGAGLARWGLAKRSIHLTVVADDRTYELGDGEAQHHATVSGSAYELWRFVYGRRDRTAAAQLAWTGAMDEVLVAGLPYPFRIPS